jgi:hypothetical protein
MKLKKPKIKIFCGDLVLLKKSNHLFKAKVTRDSRNSHRFRVTGVVLKIENLNKSKRPTRTNPNHDILSVINKTLLFLD